MRKDGCGTLRRMALPHAAFPVTRRPRLCCGITSAEALPPAVSRQNVCMSGVMLAPTVAVLTAHLLLDDQRILIVLVHGIWVIAPLRHVCILHLHRKKSAVVLGCWRTYEVETCEPTSKILALRSVLMTCSSSECSICQQCCRTRPSPQLEAGAQTPHQSTCTPDLGSLKVCVPMLVSRRLRYELFDSGPVSGRKKSMSAVLAVLVLPNACLRRHSRYPASILRAGHENMICCSIIM